MDRFSTRQRVSDDFLESWIMSILNVLINLLLATLKTCPADFQPVNKNMVNFSDVTDLYMYARMELQRQTR